MKFKTWHCVLLQKSPRPPPHRRALYKRLIEGFAIQADSIDQKR
jgi:hypothetical protein